MQRSATRITVLRHPASRWSWRRGPCSSPQSGSGPRPSTGSAERAAGDEQRSAGNACRRWKHVPRRSGGEHLARSVSSARPCVPAKSMVDRSGRQHAERRADGRLRTPGPGETPREGRIVVGDRARGAASLRGGEPEAVTIAYVALLQAMRKWRNWQTHQT